MTIGEKCKTKEDILSQHSEVNCDSSIIEGSIEESKVSISSNYSDYYFYEVAIRPAT